MLNLIIDTSYYIDQKLKLDNGDFKLLKKYINKNVAKLYSSKIIEKELSVNIKNKLQDAKTSLDNARNKTYVYENIYNSITFPNIQDIHDQVMLNYSNLTPICLNNLVDADKVMDNFFNRKPPFSTKKKYEFPDAFILEAILEEANKIIEPFYVIAKDNDWKNFCNDSNGKLIYFSHLGGFFNECTKLQAQYNTMLGIINGYVDRSKLNLVDIQKCIEPYISYSDCYYNPEITDFNVLDFDICSLFIEDLSDNICNFAIVLKVSGEYKAHVQNEDDYIRDDETKELLFFGDGNEVEGGFDNEEIYIKGIYYIDDGSYDFLYEYNLLDLNIDPDPYLQ